MDGAAQCPLTLNEQLSRLESKHREKRTNRQVMEKFTLICKGSSAEASNQSPQVMPFFFFHPSHAFSNLSEKTLCKAPNYRGRRNTTITTITRSQLPVGKQHLRRAKTNWTIKTQFRDDSIFHRIP